MCFLCGRGEATHHSTTEGFFFFSVSLLRGFIQKIPHLLEMGINAVEHWTPVIRLWLMNQSHESWNGKPWEAIATEALSDPRLLPVYEFDETACPRRECWTLFELEMIPVSTAKARRNPENGEQLCHFWGYSTVPQPRSVSSLQFFIPWRCWPWKKTRGMRGELFCPDAALFFQRLGSSKTEFVPFFLWGIRGDDPFLNHENFSEGILFYIVYIICHRGWSFHVVEGYIFESWAKGPWRGLSFA